MIFNSVVDVLENMGNVPGPFGKPVPRWEVQRYGVRCAVQRTDGTETRVNAGTVQVVDFIIFGPVDPPWTGNSRLRYKGQDLEILDVDRDVVERHHHSETVAKRIGTQAQ